ncbi:hypothetical protein ACA910_004740 [Epithemia clementina (nom. ined.)]
MTTTTPTTVTPAAPLLSPQPPPQEEQPVPPQRSSPTKRTPSALRLSTLSSSSSRKAPARRCTSMPVVIDHADHDNDDETTTCDTCSDNPPDFVSDSDNDDDDSSCVSEPGPPGSRRRVAFSKLEIRVYNVMILGCGDPNDDNHGDDCSVTLAWDYDQHPAVHILEYEAQRSPRWSLSELRWTAPERHLVWWNSITQDKTTMTPTSTNTNNTNTTTTPLDWKRASRQWYKQARSKRTVRIRMARKQPQSKVMTAHQDFFLQQSRALNKIKNRVIQLHHRQHYCRRTTPEKK